MFTNKVTVNIKRRLYWPLIILAGLLLALIGAGCAAMSDAAGEPAASTTGAVQIPAETQRYVDLSREALAQRLQIDPDQVALESVTEPAAVQGAYIVKLTAGGELYEYRGKDGEVVAVSPPTPKEPGRLVFAPAPVGGVRVQINPAAPAPLTAVVTGTLPDNCTEVDEGAVSRVGERTFAVSLATRRPAGKACGEVAVPYETAVSLGVEAASLPAGEYTVVVNDQVSETFTLDPSPASGGLQSLPEVTVTVEDAVATGSTSRQLPAVEPGENVPYFGLYPERVEVTFDGYGHQDSLHAPRLYVYPIAAFEKLNDAAEAPIARLQELLVKKPALDELESLPFLPFFNAQQLLQVRGEYISFANGSGIRYLTQFGQAAGPIHNQELLYTFQGVTDDSQYFVAAVLPLAQIELPADLATARTTFPDGFEAYLEDVRVELAAAGPASFTPDLDALDALVRSLAVHADA